MNPDTKEKLKRGRVYAGRASGTGKHPCQIVKERDYGHQTRNTAGYEPANLDSWAVLIRHNRDLRHLDPAYQFIRGRENNIIKGMGGPIRRDASNEPRTRSGNIIWGIDENAKVFRELCETLAEIHPITPHIDWDGSEIICY